jgi:hypothetical protein
MLIPHVTGRSIQWLAWIISSWARHAGRANRWLGLGFRGRHSRAWCRRRGSHLVLLLLEHGDGRLQSYSFLDSSTLVLTFLSSLRRLAAVSCYCNALGPGEVQSYHSPDKQKVKQDLWPHLKQKQNRKRTGETKQGRRARQLASLVSFQCFAFLSSCEADIHQVIRWCQYLYLICWLKTLCSQPPNVYLLLHCKLRAEYGLLNLSHPLMRVTSQYSPICKYKNYWH